MAGLQELRSQAKALGIPSSLIRANMNDAEKLSDLIASFEKGKAHVTQVTSKSKVKSDKGGSKVAKPVARAKAKAKAKAKAGRPTMRPRRKATSTTARKQTTARKAQTVARKRTVSKSTTSKRTVRKSTSNGDAGRHTIDRVNFKNTDGWNPREGSAVEEIWLALKKNKGDREATFNTLKSRVWEFVGKTMADGSKRDKASALSMLKYRISRTLFDFVTQTGQHEVSENRIEYGSGSGNGSRKKATAKKAVKKATASAPKKRGRPKGSTTKAKATKPAARRTTRRKARAGRR